MSDKEFDISTGLRYLTLLRKRGVEVRSLVVRQHGRVVFEHVAVPFALNLVHPLYSVTKSFTSVAVGMLVDAGTVELSRPWITWFPEYRDQVADSRFLSVTVRNLLTMTLGQDAEPYPTGGDDWALGVVGKPLAHDPGTVFLYNSMCSHLLSLLVERVSGQTEEDFLAERLFKPLGITRWWWEKDAAGHSTGGLGLHLSTPDLARFGQCLLNGGRWEGRQIVPAAWVAAATSKQVDTEPWYPAEATEDRNGYGYQYWMCRRGGVRCAGLFGQLCYMRPEDELVVAASSSTGGSKPLLDPFYEVFLDGLEVPVDDVASLDTLPGVAGDADSPFAGRMAGRHELEPNVGGFTTVSVEPVGDGILRVTLARGDELFAIEAACGTWHEASVAGTYGLGKLFPFALHDAERDEAPAWAPRATYACYGWTASDTLELQLREQDRTRRVALRLCLDGNRTLVSLGCEAMLCGLKPTSYLMVTAD